MKHKERHNIEHLIFLGILLVIVMIAAFAVSHVSSVGKAATLSTALVVQPTATPEELFTALSGCLISLQSLETEMNPQAKATVAAALTNIEKLEDDLKVQIANQRLASILTLYALEKAEDGDIVKQKIIDNANEVFARIDQNQNAWIALSPDQKLAEATAYENAAGWRDYVCRLLGFCYYYWDEQRHTPSCSNGLICYIFGGSCSIDWWEPMDHKGHCICIDPSAPGTSPVDAATTLFSAFSSEVNKIKAAQSAMPTGTQIKVNRILTDIQKTQDNLKVVVANLKMGRIASIHALQVMDNDAEKQQVLANINQVFTLIDQNKEGWLTQSPDEQLSASAGYYEQSFHEWLCLTLGSCHGWWRYGEYYCQNGLWCTLFYGDCESYRKPGEPEYPNGMACRCAAIG